MNLNSLVLDLCALCERSGECMDRHEMRRNDCALTKL